MPSSLRNAVSAALLLAVTSGPSPAASSAATRIFLDNLIPNVDFLDRSSRLAVEHAGSARLKTFAEREAREQTAAIDIVYDWTQARTRIAQAGSPAPVADRTGGTASLDPTPTGSIRVAWPPPATTPPEVDPRLPRSQEDLDSLGGLDGAEFDAAFKEKQTDALAQVVADYAGYLAKGDDPALLELAKAQLPQAQTRLKALAALSIR